METHLRTIAKTITWRIIATITAIAITYYYTQDWRISLTAGGVMAIIKTIFYYIHERIWNNVHWERKKITK